MKCQKCNRNDANVHYTESINGETREFCLCSECAKEMGILEKTEGMFRNMEQEMMSAFALPFAGLSFGGFGLPFSGVSRRRLGEKRPAFTAPFPEAGEFFDTDPVENMTLSSATDDQKKEAKTVTKADDVNTLKAKLLDAIADERYEDAARLRDEIKKLKGE
ncbi:MAG: UvrB/UvrC motif-containing protein [Oscillospiraceae bacterium]|nr:UvrB/UvrC motif-containing protein [Oscillospiraceae bacterium]